MIAVRTRGGSSGVDTVEDEVSKLRECERSGFSRGIRPQSRGHGGLIAKKKKKKSEKSL